MIQDSIVKATQGGTFEVEHWEFKEMEIKIFSDIKELKREERPQVSFQ